MLRQDVFSIRNATQKDLPELLELEKIWPESSRATEQELKRRIEAFAVGYFVAEDDAGIYASVVTYPYQYDPSDLSNYQNWKHVNQACFLNNTISATCNALYVISATSKKNTIGGQLAKSFMKRLVNLAQSIYQSYIVAGVLLPGYANYIKKHGGIEPAMYVSKQFNGRFVDPMIEKLSRIGFSVPTKQHVIANYFPDEQSLNYSALVVKTL